MNKILLVTAISLVASLSVAHADPVGDVIVFGDSSADLGTLGADARPTNIGQMWSERFADQIDLTSTFARKLSVDPSGTGFQLTPTGGNSYAVNGSTILPYAGVFTLQDQVDFFVADKGRFKPDDLVFIWMTRNDITSASFGGLAYDPTAYAKGFASQVDRMRALGARNLVSFGAELDFLPRQFILDLGLPPESLLALREATVASEAALWPLLAERDVFILDIDRLGEDVRSNPAKYGFRSTTDSYQGRADPDPLPSQAYPNDGNVFTADGHYTTAMQAVVADFALAQLRAREQIASVFAQVETDFDLAHASAASDAAWGRRVHKASIDAAGWRFFGGPAFNAARQDRSGQLDQDFKDNGGGQIFGVDRLVGSDLMIGGRLTVDQRKGQFADKGGTVKRSTALLSLYASAELGDGLILDGAASIGRLDIDLFERRAALGDTALETTSGASHGSFLGARMGAVKTWQLGGWSIDAGAAISFMRTKIDGFEEQAGVLALAYGDTEHNTVKGYLSTSIRYGEQDAAFSPFLNARYSYDLTDDPLKLDVGPNRRSLATFAVDRSDRENLFVEVGLTHRLDRTLEVSASLSLNHSDVVNETSAFQVFASKRF